MKDRYQNYENKYIRQGKLLLDPPMINRIYFHINEPNINLGCHMNNS